jgi:hypothetical protein
MYSAWILPLPASAFQPAQAAMPPPCMDFVMKSSLKVQLKYEHESNTVQYSICVQYAVSTYIESNI